MDNVIALSEGTKWANSQGLEALLIKIDFEKAYNKAG